MVRFKNRYIVAEINPEAPVPKFNEFIIQETALNTSVRNKVQQLYGDFGSAAISHGFIVKYCNKYLRTILLRVRHGPHRFITSSLPFIDKISDKKVAINLVYVGATMKKCFQFLIKYHKLKSIRELRSLKGNPDYANLYRIFTTQKFSTT